MNRADLLRTQIIGLVHEYYKAAFPTTINPIIQNQLIPVFIDVTIPTYNVDVAQLEEAWSERTGDGTAGVPPAKTTPAGSALNGNRVICLMATTIKVRQLGWSNTHTSAEAVRIAARRLIETI